MTRTYIKVSIVLALIFTLSCKEDKVVLPEVVADFSVNSNIIFEGEQVTYTDLSTGDPSKWEWTFEGGTPATSSQQNPVVQYNTSGVFGATLLASNAQNSNTAIKGNFIKVESKLKKGLIAHYLLDGNANDDTGNQVSGTIVGNTAPTSDRFGNQNSAYEFTTNGDRIDIQTGYDLTGSFSMFCWVKLNSSSTVQSHHIFNVDGTIGFLLRTPDGLRIVLDDPQGNQVALNTSNYSVYNDLKWHFVGYTYDGQQLVIYVDGKVALSTLGNVSITKIDGVGSIGNHNTAFRPLVGAVDDFRVYNRALDASEVEELFSN